MSAPGKRSPNKFSSTIQKSSSEDFELFCQSCDQADERLPAAGYCIDCEEHLCETCFNNHRKPKPSRHHNLLDKHSMPKTQQLTTTALAGGSNTLTKPCSQHKKEPIKYYCHDHNVLLCGVCVTLVHVTSSCKVNYIPDVSEQVVDSDEYSSVLSKIDALSKEFKNVTEKLKKLTENSNSSLTDVLADKTKYRKEINQRLSELENTTEEYANALKQENDRRQIYVETTSDDAIKSLEAASINIKQLNMTREADKLYVELKLAQLLMEDGDRKLSSLTSLGDVQEYHFKPNQPISNLLGNETSLGAVTNEVQRTSTLSTSSSTYAKTTQCTPDENIYIWTPEDACSNWITGIVLLNKSQLIITDFNVLNSSLKLVDINGSSIAHRVKLSSNASDITSIGDNKFAITQPNQRSIQFISIVSNKLIKMDTLRVNGQCHGISCYQGKLAVSFIHPTKLQVIDLKGKLLTSTMKDDRNENIFSYPAYVATNSNSIYVSDQRGAKIIRLNWHGEVIGTYGNLCCPRCLAMLDDGSILVSNMEDDKGNIHHVSADCTRGEIVLEDLASPYAICWFGEGRKLYISSYGDDEKISNFIKVFKMNVLNEI